MFRSGISYRRRWGGARRKGSDLEETASAESIPSQLDSIGVRVFEIIRAKALISHQLHCQSQALIGGVSLAEWLDTCASHPQHDLDILTALSQATPWTQPGVSSKSLLVRELSWEGRMFGAFSHNELVALAAWIDSLDGGHNNRA